MQTEYRYAGVDECEICNGNGFGVTLFVQGCSHHCEGCHNPSTWDPEGGMVFTDADIQRFMDRCYDEHMTRLTISGGEPFDSPLTEPVAVWFKQTFPQKQLWIYTGYLFDDLLKNNTSKSTLELADVIVDGPFILNNRNITLAFRGSSNQRIIDVHRSFATNSVVLYK